MRFLYGKIVFLSFLFGALVWLGDAVFDRLYFYEDTFVNLLIFNVPAHELYIRSLFMLFFLLFGGVVCLFVSRMKRLNRSMAEQKEYFRTTLHSIGDAVIATDPGARVVYMNPRARDLTGWTMDQAQGRLLNEVFCTLNAQTRQRCPNPLEKALETGKVQSLCNDTILVAREGTEYLIADSCAPIRDASGLVTGAVLVFRDVSEQYRQQQALRESQVSFENLFEQAAIGIFLSDENHRVTDANQRALDILGYEKQEILKMSALDLLHSDSLREASPDNTRAKLLSGEIVDIERKYRKKDGTYIDVLVSMRKLETPGTSNSHMIMFQDITDRKKAEQEKERLNAQLRHAQKMEAVGTLAGGIAHDFNNILSIIMGYAELIDDDLPPQGPARGNLKQIRDAAGRARDLVRHLLTFSRSEEQEKTPQEIGLVIKEAAKMMDSATPASVDIRSSIPSGLPLVRADISQMHQLIVNLCKNAADAMEAQGGVMSVELDAVSLSEQEAAFDPDLAAGEFVRLRVSDTGQGLSPEQIERIFDPYYTTKAMDRGAGLGLSIVLGIVKSHGGGIRVFSEPGEGSAFEVYLPAASGLTTEPEREARQMPPGGTERILFVDDETSVANLNQLRLEKLGYRVTSETDPKAALERFLEDPAQFDLVITDMSMPEMSGETLSRQILEIRPDMKIIICTGYSETMTSQHAGSLGIAEFLQKPIGMQTLAEAVRRALDGRTSS